MNVTHEADSPTEVTLNISMDSADEEPFLNRSYRRVVGRLSIPGFRKGKAPRSIVESHVGRVALVQEALDFMIPESLDQILKEHDIKAFSEPQLEVLDLEPVSYKAVVPLEPSVELGDIRSIRLEKDPVEITDEQVEHVLEELRFESAPWEPVQRPVAFGDLATINVKGTIAGEQAIDDDGVDFIPQKDNDLPLPGFSDYLEGMTEGQSKEFTLAVPDDYPQQEYAGKDCRFNVEVLSVKEKQLPELDDEFAKGVREGFESLEALNAHIRQRLTEEAENAAVQKLERASLEEVKKLATIQASDIIYQRELDSMYEDRERALRNQRLDMDTYLGYLGQTADEWREQLRPQAEERLNTFLVMKKLADLEGLEVNEEEVQGEIDRLVLTSAGESETAMRRALDTQSARDSISTSLVSRKVMARLVEIVQGIESGAPAESGQPEDAADPSGETAEENREASSEETGEHTVDEQAGETEESNAGATE